MSEKDKPCGPWSVEARQAYAGLAYWVVWKHNPNRYGGQECLPNASRTDAKRFYAEDKAIKTAERLNAAQPTKSE